jgi:nitroreductase
MLNDLVLRNRSYRRFFQEVLVPEQILLELVDLARLSASARNMQSLRYLLSNDSKKNDLIFSTLTWAAYLKNWDGPVEGERPSAYIIILNDNTLSTNYYCDHGIASQSILLGAVEKGFGGCIIASIAREKLRIILHIPEKFEIVQIIAIGKPKETVVIEPCYENGDIKYWHDENQIHHLPKRSLDEIILKY